MNKRIFKYVIITIITLMSLLGISSVVEAKDLSNYGSQVNVDAWGRGGSDINRTKENFIIDGVDDTYCVYPHMDLWQGSLYNILYRIEFDGTHAKIYNGNTSTLMSETDNMENAKMAWILANPDPIPGNPMVRNYSPKQLAIYGFFGKWLATTGIGDFITRSLGYANPSWEVSATEYAQTLSGQQGASITNNRGEDAEYVPESIIYNIDGKEEEGVKVGPFNVNMVGDVTGLKVYDQDEKEIASPVFGKYEGDQLKVTRDPKEVIENGSDFYIIVPADGSVEQITKVDLSVSKKYNYFTAKMWLVGKRGPGIQTANQNLISSIAKPSTKEDSKTVNLINKPIDLLGDLIAQKVNQDNHEVKLDKVSFKFQNERSKKWIVREEDGKIRYVDNEEEATVFTTASEEDVKEGRAEEVGIIKIEDVVVGTYLAFEQEGNPHYGYPVPPEGKPVKVVAKKAKKEDGTEEKIEPVLIENKQVYVKLSGYVWRDDLPDEKSHNEHDYDKYTNNTTNTENVNNNTNTENDSNNEANTENSNNETNTSEEQTGNVGVGTGHGRDDYYTEDVDTLLGGIIVRLKKGEEVVQETTTDENGAYLFIDVLIEELESYHIEFEYNGLTYTNVVPHIEVDNGSKAAEDEETRVEFNKNFSAIEGKDAQANTAKTIGADGQEKFTLEYKRGEGEESHKSFFDFYTDGYSIIANTNATGYSIWNNFEYGMEEVKYINLGLYEREQADLSLQKDLQNARVAINGFEHTYNYENRFKNKGNYQEGFNVGVKFDNTRGTAKYTRPIYKADAAWQNPSDTSKELKVGITYRIRAINEAGQVKAKVNKIMDYYDKNYTVVKVGTGIDEKGEITGELNYTDNGSVNDQYNSLTIEPEERIIDSVNNPYKNEETPTEEQREETKEKPAEGDENAEVKIPENEKEYKPLGNLEEEAQQGDAEAQQLIEASESTTNYQDIYVYFTMNREKVKEIAMLNSENPEEQITLDNLAEIASYTSYDQENNLYAAVDKDSVPENMIIGNEETYEDDTDKAPAFILQIGEDDLSNRHIKGNVFEDLKTSSETGNALLGNGIYDPSEAPVKNVKAELIPVGDGSTDVEESMSNDSGEYELKGFVPGTYKIKFTWGGDTGAELNGKLLDPRDYKSTNQPKAEWERKTSNPKWYRDDIDTRYSDAVDDWTKRQEIDATTEHIVYGNATLEGPIPEMTSETPEMQLTVELEDFENGVTVVEIEGNKDETLTENDVPSEKVQDAYLQYVLKNVDFGVIERPKQSLDLKKRLSEVSFILPNGQILMETKINEDGTYDPVSGFTYLPPTDNSNGTAKLEIDNELLQGSTLQVGYEFKVSNTGEVDYADEAFYNFGEIPADQSTMVTLSAEEIVDYLDSDWGFDVEKNPNWEEVTKEEIEGDKGTCEVNGLRMFADEVINSEELAKRRILKTTTMAGPIKPGENKTTTLSVSKVMSAKEDDVDLGNETEIIHVKKSTESGNPGGRRIVTVPGNYVPGTSTGPETESDDSTAESVTVTPPTGDDENLKVIISTVVGIVALATFGVGVIIIKKTVV